MVRKLLLILVMLWFSGVALANTVKIKMYRTGAGGHDKLVGYIIATDTRYGLLIKPHLHGLSPGLHGFHLHQYPSCKKQGMAAKGHYDPQQTQKHLGPYDHRGHLGDLPALYVNQQGIANLPILAPRLKVTNLQGHALMIHAGGDNYKDQPKKLGGGSARIACGVVH